MNLVPFYKWSKLVKANTWHHSCEICWCTSNLESHHIIPSSISPEYTCDLDNGICLCHDCHVVLHGYAKNHCIDPSIFRYYAHGHVREKAALVAKYLKEHPQLVYWNIKHSFYCE